MEHKETVLDEFKKKASSASYHYADDSGKEWRLARGCVSICRDMLKNYPEYRDDLIKIAKTQLCASEITRGFDA